MSAQTGSDSLAPPPPGSTRMQRARWAWRSWFDDPNPVWMREMRQSLRLRRTPIILAALTSLIALIVCSIGGLASVRTRPDRVGGELYQVFFSLAFAVVAWLAPAVAATTIANERNGRTWEALLLSGLTPGAVARGKFFSALTYISLYVVMLAPVGAVPLLFGGVTAIDVVAAFGLLLLISIVAVTFGLSLSSKFESTTSALVVTLLLAVPLSVLVFTVFGPLMGELANDAWSGVPDDVPVWLPMSYARVDFGIEYLTFLVLVPAGLFLFPAWFFYEVTVANLLSPSDDRSSPLRRWFLVTSLGLTFTALAVTLSVRDTPSAAAFIGMLVTYFHYTFAAFVFAGEPVAPSQRVRTHWDRERVGWLVRQLGPGTVPATAALMLVLAICIPLQGAVGSLAELLEPGSSSRQDVRYGLYLLAFVIYAVGFGVFQAGAAAWLRSRASGASRPRLLLAAIIFAAMVGPWIAMAIGGMLSDTRDRTYLLAAPSPTYFAVVMDNADSHYGSRREVAFTAEVVCAAAWMALGLMLWSSARRRVRKLVAEREELRARVEQQLLEEDEALTAEPALAGAPESADGVVG